MYCAYTIPGVSGGSFMYYYNGKAVSTDAYLRLTSDGRSTVIHLCVCVICWECVFELGRVCVR